MNNRLEKFKSYEYHAWFGRIYKQMERDEIESCISFINENSHLNYSEYEIKVNRMFLNNENKPKRWKIILELLTCSNVI